MKIETLKLKNYRNYEELDIKLHENLNIVIGDNAQGKTNILESIYVLAITKSFLSIPEKKMIMFNKDFFRIEANVISDGVEKKLEIITTPSTKKVKINNQEIKRIGDYISHLNVLLFNPDNIRMIKEGPHVRRKYLNVEISQLNNKYINILNEYNIILKQKNEFLKIINVNIKSNIDYLDILNSRLVEKAVDIYKYRKKFIDRINNKISDIFKVIAGYGNLKLLYISQVDDVNSQANLLEKLKKNYQKELNYKVSLIGTHRDDFHFILDDKDISLYGSQGQLRVAILALKLAEVSIFYEDTNENPILLLDDIFSELDINKRNKLIELLDNDVQTIITTTDLHSIDERLTKNAKIFKISQGKLVD